MPSTRQRASQPSDLYRRLAAVEATWLDLAAEVGWNVHRDRSCFVSYDGAGTLTIAPHEDLDRDDSVAALVLHEICHLAVRGDVGLHEPDWGLVYEEDLARQDPTALANEHAALRLQRRLASAVGAAGALHPTTIHRGYYEALEGAAEGEPLSDSRFVAGEAEVLTLAAVGSNWLQTRPWWPALGRALQQTALAAYGGGTGPHQRQA